MSQPSSLIAAATTHQDKYITFHLNGYRFALPSQYVLKIMVTPSSNQGGKIGIGLVQLAQYSIQILNLQTLLKLEQQSSQSETVDESLGQKTFETTNSVEPTFLIILQPEKTEKDLWGLVVEQAPDLQNISHNQLKPIPNSRKIADALNGISHIVAETPNHSKTQADKSLSPEEHPFSLVLDVPKLIELSRK